MKSVFKVLSNERGTSAIEYALIASLISVAAIAGYSSLGAGVKNNFNATSNAVADAL
jgi:pilus assembly protein Flp/PilA